MTLQLLVAAVNKNALELAEEMQIESDAIIVSQGNGFSYEEVTYNEHRIRYFSMEEKGVGLNRNTALLHADADLVLFADEDIVYEKGYQKKVTEAFEKYPQADMLLFNVQATEGRETYYNHEFGRVRWYNCGRYPTYSFAVKREKLIKNGIMFSLLFGGGAKYSNGEDSLFIRDCLKNGLKIYKVPVKIGNEKERPSTWFHGYNRKFFFDRGVLYSYLYGKMAGMMALRFLLRNRKTMCTEFKVTEAYGIIREGIREGKNR